MNNNSPIKPDLARADSTTFQGWILFKYLFKRCLRQKSYQYFILCLFISSFLMSLIGFFSSGVQSSLNEDISKFLGAPLVIASEQPLADKWWHTTENFSEIQATITASFTYGIIGNFGDSGMSGYQSIGIKAVSPNYPKQDAIKIVVDSEEILTSASTLKPMDAWLDQRALTELKLKQGDKFQVGQQYFNVAAKIVFEPDRLTQLQHLLPRVMIRMDDLESIGLDLENGRGEYRYLFNEQPELLNHLEASLGHLISSPYHVLKANAGEHPFSKIAQRSEKMLSLVMVLIMLMCGSAAALVADFAMKHFVIPATILRCLGLNKNSITLSMMMQLTALAVISSMLGTFCAWMFQPVFKELLHPHLIINQTVFDLKTPLLSLSINALIITTFIFPRLRAIGSVAIVSVLRHNLNIKKSLWFTALASFSSVILLLWYFSDNTKLTLILSLGVTLILVLSIGFGWIISQFTTLFHRTSRGMPKVVLRSIGRNPKKNIAPIATIALAVMGFLIISTLRGNFIDAYHVETLNQDGNLLFSRLPRDQIDPFTTFINTNNLTLKGIHPTVTAQLESINGINIDQALNQESDTREEALSPVRLSWSKDLPENNHLLEGQWPRSVRDGVSVESEVMSDLGLEIGDELGFRIKDTLITTTISSRREFKSGASRMMFWFMFAPDTLAEFEHQYMGGIYVDQERINQHTDQGYTVANNVLSELNTQFPQVMFADLKQAMDRVSSIMQSLMNIMSALLLILLIAAFTVLMASSFVGAQDQQQTIMRSLGVSRKKLILMNIFHQGLIGLVSCLVGILGAQLISGALFEQLFNMHYQADIILNLIITLVTTFSFIAFGLILSYNIHRKPLLINQINQNS